MAEDVVLILRERFGQVPQAIGDRLGTQRELPVLQRWVVLALRAASVAEFERAMDG
jgi:hypothetical protein